MSLPAALGTLLGLVFVFALVALFCSAVTETISTWLEKRAKYLLTGIRSMLDQGQAAASKDGAPSPDALHENVKVTKATEDAAERVAKVVASADPQAGSGNTSEHPKPGDLTMALFDHPLIRSLQTRRVNIRRDGQVRNPQYIPSGIFAQALIDTLLPKQEARSTAATARPDKDVLAALARSVSTLDPRFPARRSLLALLDQARGDLDRFEKSVEGWYDAQMGRISGWYKRWSKVLLVICGLIVAVIANLDTVQIARSLYMDEPVRTAVVAQATAGTRCQSETDPAAQQACVDGQIAELNARGLPIWYPSGCSFLQWSRLDNCWKWYPSQDTRGWQFPLKLVGWALTAFAVSFGAPFWFDALSKLGSLRTAGQKPST